MLKKVLKVSIVFVTLFYFCTMDIQAYDFINPDNEKNVNKDISDIFESRELYEELFGDGEEVIEDFFNSDMFWWPIGSDETVVVDGVLYAPYEPRTVNTSNGFGCTAENAWRTDGCHGGVDMGDGSAPGIVNVIAAKDGVVVYPTNESQIHFEDHGYYGNPEGGGYGNHVVIKHSDGIYTVYGHLAKDSITVMVGEEVKQGQVIGKMGHSGSSTGAHLHFTVGIGGWAKSVAVDPMDYIDPENPRPATGLNISLTSTILTKAEFVSRMNDYCTRSGHAEFCKNFASRAEEIYDVSLESGVNPELVVVKAKQEQDWTLPSGCKFTNNYWGIKITNGRSCSEGGIYDSFADGIRAYANILKQYQYGGTQENLINKKYEERSSAGCDPAGYGKPGTVEGMQSVYSELGAFRYNPGNWSLGGCVYLNGYMYEGNYCNTKPTCNNYDKYESNNYNICSAESRTTVCEQNDYTVFRLERLRQIRTNVFGL